MALAWHIAALVRWPSRKKLPPLKSLQAKPRNRTPQTPEQMMTIAKMWTAYYGGKVIDKSRAN